jgi:hypothetical protein
MTVTRHPVYSEIHEFSSDRVVVTTRHDVDIKTLNKYSDKIIIYSTSEMISDQDLELALSNNNNNYWILLHVANPDQRVLEKYSGCMTFIEIKYTYAHYARYMDYAHTDFQKIISTIKQKHFLSLNNRASWPRQGMFYFCKNFALEDKFLMSYWADIQRTDYASLSDIDGIFDIAPGQRVWYTQNVDYDACKKLLPLSTGLDDFQDNDWGVGNSKYYEN